METALLNGEAVLTVPEGFRVLDGEELGKMGFAGDPPEIGLRDDARHILVTAGGRKIGAFSGLLLNAKDIAGNMEKSVSGPMKAFGYRREEFLSRSFAGERAEGFRYTYEARGVPMTGESLAAKRGKTLLYLHFYTRTSLFDENLPRWEALLSGGRWRG